ncbi:MAG: response regulator transcription factor [Lachnospiraceae bacterium]|nr:response regulator transcription factor [Lachnospiraceae bacterium]
MERILIVDDDVHIGNMLEEVLRREGYAVSRAYSGTEALLVLEGAKPDLVLLDLMLPGLSGEEVLFRFSELAVIVVSARADVDSKVGLLTSGAVDYVTKPFDVRELLARIKIALREKTVSRLSVGDLRLDTATKSVFCNDIKIHLTRTEYAILKILMQNCTGVVAKHILLDRIAQDTPDCTESSLKMHVSNLRKKLREAGGKDYVEAVWGIGFRLKGSGDCQTK